MQDMTPVIQPRSDQLNADSLTGGPITVRITSVDIKPGAEQPITVHYEGENGKPWRPCKGMARAMVAAWGADAGEYTGRSLTLYTDPTVTWGGLAVGGLRISHMSHIEREMVFMNTISKGKKSPVKIKPLKADVAPLKVVKKEEPAQTEGYDFDGLSMMVAEAFTLAEGIGGSTGLASWWETMKPDRIKAGAADRARAIEIANMVKAKIAELEAKEGEV